MCCIESSSFVAVGFGTLYKQVAGFHRADPSTALDKAVCNFLIYSTDFIRKVKTFFDFLLEKIFTNLIWTFYVFAGKIVSSNDRR